MTDNTNFSTSISADKAAALKQLAKDKGLSVVDQGGGYRLKWFSANVRPQKNGTPEGQWTVICPPDQGDRLRNLIDECAEEPA